MGEAYSDQEHLEPPIHENNQYKNKSLGHIIYDFGRIRGDLTEDYARQQMRTAILHSNEVNYYRNALKLAQAKRTQTEKRLEAAEGQMAKQRTALVQALAQRDSWKKTVTFCNASWGFLLVIFVLVWMFL